MGRVTDRLGRRGAFLTLAGGIWALYGYGLIADPASSYQIGLTLLLGAASLTFWAGVWIAAGTAAIVTAWARPGLDGIGFVALVVPPLIWTLAYLSAWWPLGSYSRGWITAGIWGVAVVAVLITSGWPEPPRDGAA